MDHRPPPLPCPAAATLAATSITTTVTATAVSITVLLDDIMSTTFFFKLHWTDVDEPLSRKIVSRYDNNKLSSAFFLLDLYAIFFFCLCSNFV